MTETPKRDVFQRDNKRLQVSCSSTNSPPNIEESRQLSSKNATLHLSDECEQLKKREKELDMELELLLKESINETNLKSQMELLHEYNDVKDATQIVLGSLARLKNVSVTELHEQFGLSYVDNEADVSTQNDKPKGSTT